MLTQASDVTAEGLEPGRGFNPFFDMLDMRSKERKIDS
jgi:hypothetical protein